MSGVKEAFRYQNVRIIKLINENGERRIMGCRKKNNGLQNKECQVTERRVMGCRKKNDGVAER